MSNYKLSKDELEYLNNYRNKDGSPLTEAQREAMIDIMTIIDIMTRERFLGIEGRKLPKLGQEKPKPIKKPIAEEAIYQGRKLGFQVDTEVPIETQPDLSSYNPEQVFIFKYDDFGRALIAKVNERFRNTKAQVPTNLRPNEEVPNMHILKRSTLVTVISENPELRNLNVYPVSPLESELLLQGRRLPKPAGDFWEDLGYLLYDHSEKGINPKEAKSLYLDLSDSDLEERLLIINAGLDVDLDFPKGVKPRVIPGVTQVHSHPTLRRTGRDHRFNYGLENGLPSIQSLGNGSRTLWMPSQNEDIGLRVLCRSRGLNLDARDEGLVNSSENGRVTFVKKSA